MTLEDGPLFLIDPEVAAAFPEIHVGIAVIREVMVERETAKVEELKAESLRAVRERLSGTSTGSLPRVASTRRIYRKFGVDPTSRRPSAEALLRRVISPDRGLYRVNTVVDVYNVCSVQSQLPMAAYDLGAIAFPIRLRFSVEGEEFRAIGQQAPDTLKAGTLVYADQQGVICRDFNHRDADRTKVTLETTDLVLFVDGCDAVTRDELEDTLRTTAARLIDHNGGRVEHMSIRPAP